VIYHLIDRETYGYIYNKDIRSEKKKNVFFKNKN
jgi:hypothetical protein